MKKHITDGSPCWCDEKTIKVDKPKTINSKANQGNMNKEKILTICRQIAEHKITFGSGYRNIMDIVEDKKPLMEKYSDCCDVPAGITNNTPDGSYARICPKCKKLCNTHEKEYKKI